MVTVLEFFLNSSPSLIDMRKFGAHGLLLAVTDTFSFDRIDNPPAISNMPAY